MRLWTVHPKHLDAKGLVAVWREALLAQKVLRGETRGYRHHPQLIRFRESPAPSAAVSAYLKAVFDEAMQRGYRFDRSKIFRPASKKRIAETDGQLLYEWRHLRNKLKRRDPKRFAALAKIKTPEAHPLFRIVKGCVRDWERL